MILLKNMWKIVVTNHIVTGLCVIISVGIVDYLRQRQKIRKSPTITTTTITTIDTTDTITAATVPVNRTLASVVTASFRSLSLYWSLSWHSGESMKLGRCFSIIITDKFWELLCELYITIIRTGKNYISILKFYFEVIYMLHIL